MTDDPTDRLEAAAAAQLDATDQALLVEVAAMLENADPVPEGLVERMRFALALDEVYDEVARMSRVLDDALAVRSDLADATLTQTLTFSSDRLTVMVTLSSVAPGRVRLDGWISPAGVRRISLRRQGFDDEVSSDADGRFVAHGLREGFVQLVFHPAGTAQGEGLVVTPLFKV